MNALNRALPSAEEVLRRYIIALGGQSAIDKLESRMARGTITQSNGVTAQFELYQARPNKFYQIVRTSQATSERGFNGSVGWQKTARGVLELSGLNSADLVDLRAANDLFALIKLEAQLRDAHVSREDKIGDRDVYVVSANTLDRKREQLFFDVETGLLLRRVTYLTTIVGVIAKQIDVEDYREVNGIRFPFTWRLSSIDPAVPVSTRKFSEMNMNVPIDASKFNMPR